MKIDQSKFNIILLLSFISHLLASYFSHGWISSDEQSCILEFVNFKLGYNSDLCFLAYSDKDVVQGLKIRSWFLPFFYYLIAKFFLLFNVYNFFTLTAIFKLFSSMIGFVSIYIFYNATKNNFLKADVKKFYFILTFLFWFLPLLHSRTSAENLSISFLLIALSFYLNNKNNFSFIKIFFLGTLMGLTFVLRYNLGVCVLFFFIWFFLFEKISFSLKNKYLLAAFLGIIFIIFLELLINLWGFEGNNFYLNPYLFDISWLKDRFTPLNFFLYGSSNNFYSGSVWSNHNFFGYFKLTLLKFFPPLSVLIILSLIFMWIKNYKNFLVWVTLPYFIIHSLIPHKELRYIYPILIFSPFFVSYFLETIDLNKKFLNQIIKIILILNFSGLIFFTFNNPSQKLNILKKIYNDQLEDTYYFLSKNSLEESDPINLFNIKQVSQNYYFKFNNIFHNQVINNKVINLRKGFCNKYKCNKLEHNMLENNDSHIKFQLDTLYTDKKTLTLYLRHAENISDLEKIKEKNKLNSSNFLLFTNSNFIINTYRKEDACKIVSKKYPIWVYKINHNKIQNEILFKCLFSSDSN